MLRQKLAALNEDNFELKQCLELNKFEIKEELDKKVKTLESSLKFRVSLFIILFFLVDEIIYVIIQLTDWLAVWLVV